MLLVASSGCIRRSLTIRTDPPGAMVYVNDQLKGTSPVTYDFLWYGWHRVILRKEGFERLEDRQQLRAPIYFWIPFDLAMELLPVPIRDQRTWSYTLQPTIQLPTPVPPSFDSAQDGAPSGVEGPPSLQSRIEPAPSTPPPATTEPDDETR